MSQSSPFAALILQAMSERGLGLRALCRAARLDPSFFSKVLSGKRSPPAEDRVLRNIAAALGLDPVRLILSTGRLPEEMKSLWKNPEVRHWARSAPVATPMFSQPKASSWSARRAAPAVPTAPKPQISEELL